MSASYSYSDAGRAAREAAKVADDARRAAALAIAMAHPEAREMVSGGTTFRFRHDADPAAVGKVMAGLAKLEKEIAKRDKAAEKAAAPVVAKRRARALSVVPTTLETLRESISAIERVVAAIREAGEDASDPTAFLDVAVSLDRAVRGLQTMAADEAARLGAPAARCDEVCGPKDCKGACHA